MVELPTSHIRLSCGNPTTKLFCPHCHSLFPSMEHIIHHLSSNTRCGRWAAESLPSVDGDHFEPNDDYFEDENSAADGVSPSSPGKTWLTKFKSLCQTLSRITTKIRRSPNLQRSNLQRSMLITPMPYHQSLQHLLQLWRIITTGHTIQITLRTMELVRISSRAWTETNTLPSVTTQISTFLLCREVNGSLLIGSQVALSR